MHIYVTSLLLVILLIILHLHNDVFFKKKEHAELGAPSISQVITDVYRDKIKDKLGMTVNDYILGSSLLNNIRPPNSKINIL